MVGSRQDKDFEEYLVPKSDWNGIDPNFTKLAVSLSTKEYLEERTEALLQRLNWVSALHADANPHYGTGKGATIYRFVSDQFSTFYTKVINTNARDAVHFIDGLLHHETNLAIEEHYSDTVGYTDQVFGLTHLLGFRFAPRLRDLADFQALRYRETFRFS
ncbi:Tn3 family transposase [Paenibacillus polymyxa]|uniref:Tn3 family transposase n=1 Tax=Paenibacillus polymyxa TaxID=1406 RepID=UPI0039BD0DD9